VQALLAQKRAHPQSLAAKTSGGVVAVGTQTGGGGGGPTGGPTVGLFILVVGGECGTGVHGPGRGERSTESVRGGGGNFRGEGGSVVRSGDTIGDIKTPRWICGPGGKGSGFRGGRRR
jgi:hypothetical protein